MENSLDTFSQGKNLSERANETRKLLSAIAAPLRQFGSDNQSGVHPVALAAIAEASSGHHIGYGDDIFTRSATQQFCKLFDRELKPLFVWNGTGANVLGIGALLGRGKSVLCAQNAHVYADEAGAPENMLDAKIVEVQTNNGKIDPEALKQVLELERGPHHVTPGVVSITQSSEIGTLYSVSEIAQLCELAHDHGCLVHVDGARIANAFSALGYSFGEDCGVKDLSALTFDLGVDSISFGGTKNAMAFGEAVLFANPKHEQNALVLVEQYGQLSSKMRFISSEFNALLESGTFFETARNSNHMAMQLYKGLAQFESMQLTTPPQVNSLFPLLDREISNELEKWCFFYPWDETSSRLVCSWDTQQQDVDQFVSAVAVLSKAGLI